MPAPLLGALPGFQVACRHERRPDDHWVPRGGFRSHRRISLAHLVRVIEDLAGRGVHFMTAEDGFSTKGSTGKLVLNILGSIAQFEHNLMLERTQAGLAAAKAKGRVGGRRRMLRMLGPAEVTKARQMLNKRAKCRRCCQHAQGQSAHSVQGAARGARGSLVPECRL